MRQYDEIETADPRHSLAEAWRVVCARRWWFVFPFAVATTLAFVASHWLPRQYTARTLFERRNDVVLSSLIGQAWDQAFEAQRRSLTFDLIGPSALAEAVDKTGLADTLIENATTTAPDPSDPNVARLRSDTLARLAERVAVNVVESSPQRDVIEARVVHQDPRTAARLVVALRDNYVERTTQRMLALMDESLEYFTHEAEQTAARVAEMERRLIELEKSCPGVAPDFVQIVAGEVNGLSYERAELRRRLGELAVMLHGAERDLAVAERTAADLAQSPPPMYDNPRRRVLSEEIDRLRRQIEDQKVLHGKTDEHPTVVALYDKMERLREEYARTPAQLPVTDPSLSSLDTVVQSAAQMNASMAAAREQRSLTEARLAAVQARLDEIERQKMAGVERRAEHVALTQQLAQARSELVAWRKQIDPIQRIIEAQNRDRGVRFIAVQEPNAVTRPTSPDARITLLMCLAVGLAGGVLSALAAELLDRSIRTAGQAARSLGIPVIETIDEIVTAAIRRQQALRRMVLLPAATIASVALLIGSGLSAYLSIEAPWLHERLRAHVIGLAPRPNIEHATVAPAGRDDVTPSATPKHFAAASHDDTETPWAESPKH